MTSPQLKTSDEAERWLLERELFGMRFGLDRMRRLLTALDSPQDAFRSVHVVGTNGKSSTVRMTASIVQHHGLKVGAYLSPHLVSFRERIRIDDEDLSADAFAHVVAEVARAAVKVDRTLEPGDRVTQFEALTAAAYVEFARRGVDVAVVEAGLGGRWDATNVIASEVQVLTNVGLEHTRWLGPTIRDIAAEKLAVVKATDPPGTLVLGADLHPDAAAEAARTPAAEVIVAPPSCAVDLELVALGSFQRRNFALARTAAEALLGELRDDAVRAAAAAVRVPGRFHVVDRDPLTILDGAHNPSGMHALAEALADHAEPLVAVVSVLDDKDAAAMLSELLPLCDEVICTASANPRALPPGTLASLTEQLGGPPSRLARDPHKAVSLARDLAGPQGAVLATGSIYLVADLLRPLDHAGPTSRL